MEIGMNGGEMELALKSLYKIKLICKIYFVNNFLTNITDI